jgi:hypothetical protein
VIEPATSTKDKEWKKMAEDPKNSSTFWKHLKKEASRDVVHNKDIEPIELDVPTSAPNVPRKTNGPTEACKIFRDQYEKIGGDHPPQVHSFVLHERARQKRRVQHIMSLPEYQCPIDSDINIAEVCTAICRLKFRKASGLDFISTEILKIADEAVAPTLCMIFNQCLQQTRCPEAWQMAVVSCLHKGKGLSKSDWKSYRLISLLSVVGKLFEAIFSNRITNYLNENNLLSSSQGGFRGGGRRCSHHSWALAEIIKSTARQGKLTFVAFLDVKKAYPTVFRAALLERLHVIISKGPGGNPNQRSKTWSLIQDMYKKCTSKIRIDGHESEEYEVLHGLREGAPLSPILYAVFIDAVAHELEKCDGVKIGAEKFCSMLYADDIVLTSESAEDLQRMLDICQKFADESSFQFSMEQGKSHVMVFGDDDDHPFEWKLGNETITQTDHYKYLGIHFHRSLGIDTKVGLMDNYMKKKHTGMRFRDEDQDVNCIIQSVYFCHDDSTNTERWIAETVQIDNKGVPIIGQDIVEYFLTDDNRSNSTKQMQKMIALYDQHINNGKEQREHMKVSDPWIVHQDAQLKKMTQKHSELSRAGCKSGRQGIQTSLAMSVVKAMTTSISTFGSEVWQQSSGKPGTCIASHKVTPRLNTIHNMVLGTAFGSNNNIVRYELGVPSQELRAEIETLGFLNSIINLDPVKHNIGRVFNALRNQSGGKGHGGIKNGAKYLLSLALSNKWDTSLSRMSTKIAAKKHMKQKQLLGLKRDIKKGSSVLKNLESWDNLDRVNLAPYLERWCPGHLKYGRRLKSRLRCGSHNLQCIQAHRDRSEDKRCKCCTSGVTESVEHNLLRCKTFSRLRNSFLHQMDIISDEKFSSKSKIEQLKIIMSDETPKEFDRIIYRYLQDLDRDRKACLDSI